MRKKELITDGKLFKYNEILPTSSIKNVWRPVRRICLLATSVMIVINARAALIWTETRYDVLALTRSERIGKQQLSRVYRGISLDVYFSLYT